MMDNWNNRNGGLNLSPNPTINFNYRRYEIIRVSGEDSARSFRMAPNSETFLADTSDPHRLWLVQTDGAGYLTCTPLDVDIHKEQPMPTILDLDNRIKHLEEMYEQQFNSRSSKQYKKQRSNDAAATESGESSISSN